MRFLGMLGGVIALTVIAGTGCSNSSGSGGVPAMLAVDGAVPQTTSGRYQPLVVGASWAYKVTDNGVGYTKTSSVDAYEDIGGPAAGVIGYRVSETMQKSTQLTWYESTDTDVRRHHDQKMDSSGNLSSEDWYTPYRLRVDESPDHLMAGATWTTTYQDAHTSARKPSTMATITDNWSADAVDEVVTEPAGTFQALKITVTNAADGAAKSYWFVQGVGKVREQDNNGHLEELTSFNVPTTNGGG